MNKLIRRLIIEGITEVTAEKFLKDSIKGTKWEGKVYIAGGYVRDQIMGFDPKDIDIVVDAPNGGIEFSTWFTKKIGNFKEGSNPVVYPKFGTAKFTLAGVVSNGIDLSNIEIEAVMPRSEKYEPGSRKPSVAMSTMKTDAERRDLTINSLYKNVSSGEVLDLTGTGKDDIQNKILRTPLDADQTFTDDPLRMMRVVRFYAKYGFDIPLPVIKALKRNAEKLNTISKERIKDELNKILVSNSPAKAFKLLKISGLLPFISSDLQNAVGMKQNAHHTKDVFGHTLDVVQNTKPELLNRLMALFHDIGKTVTRSVTPTGVHFYGHEDAGAQMVRKIMQDLKYPNELTDAVVVGVANHMKLKHGGDDAVNISDKTLRKFQSEVGDKLESLLDVIHADNIAHADESAMKNQIDIVRKRFDALKQSAEFSPKKMPINGHDVIKLGVKAGPKVKEILAAVLDAFYENPDLTREEAIKIANRLK